MNSYFSVYTYTPWDSLKNNQLTQIKLLSLKTIFKTYPIIEKEFFKDLTSNLSNNAHYSIIQSIKRITGTDNKDYDIKNFSFIWAFDDQGRMFQFLFQKIEDKKKISQGVLVALAPPELGKLFASHKSDAILRTLSLLNNPSKVKFLMILAPKGRSLVEEQQLFPIDKENLEKVKFVNMLKEVPNIKGQWFFSREPRCPICNSLLTGIKDYKVGLARLICPRCGYKKYK